MAENRKSRFDRRKDQTRSALHAAAQGLILKKGFSAVTIDDIVQTADVARGTFYLHYPNKEELVWAIVESHLESMDARHDAQFPARRGTRATQRAGITAAFEQAASNRKLYLLILGPQGSAAVAYRFHEHLAAETEREIAARHVYVGVRTPAPILAQFFAGALLRLIVWWLESGSTISAEKMGALTVDMLHPPREDRRKSAKI